MAYSHETNSVSIVVRATGQMNRAYYMANRKGNKQYNVDGKFYNDKQFNKLFKIVP